MIGRCVHRISSFQWIAIRIQHILGLWTLFSLSESYLITYLLTPWSRVLLKKLTGSQLVKKFPPHFMEPECSLPHLQVPATCPYPEPARFSQYPHIPLPEDPSKYYPPIYAWVFEMAPFSQVSPPKPCIHLFSPPIRATCPAHLILLDFVTQVCQNVTTTKLMIIKRHPVGSRALRTKLFLQETCYRILYC